jgi:hypothetical protein
MKATNPIIDIANPPVTIPVTVEQLLSLGLSLDDINKGEARGDLKTRGAWGVPVSYRAVVENGEFDNPKGYTENKRARFWAVRTMTNVRQSGHHLEGRVSLNGKKYRAFTTSQMFELPDGKLISVATIFACEVK